MSAAAASPAAAEASAIASDGLVDVLNRIRTLSENGAPLGEALSLAEEFLEGAKSFLTAEADPLVSELSALSGQIARTRTEIAALQPNAIKHGRIPEAGRELEAIVQHTEDATNQIMQSAEAIMAADPTDPIAYHNLVQDQVLNIFQACSFQDITGQRISKVISVLTYIEERIGRLLEAAKIDDADFATDQERAEQERAEENLLHGPELPVDAKSQDAVDEIFSQSDIDALFD